MRPLFAVVALGLSAAPSVAEWKSLVDPPTPAAAPWAVAPKLDAPTPKSFHDVDVTFAADGGPFVAIGRNGGKDDERVVIDLRTGAAVATLDGELQLKDPTALSRDGKRFAAGARGLRGESVAVLDLGAGGKVLAELAVPGPHGVRGVLFVGPDRVAVRGHEAIRVYDLAAGGKALAEVRSHTGREGPPAATPGGKYLFVTEENKIRAHDAATGAEVAALTAPKISTGLGHVEGLAVSPDGARLATLVGWPDKRLVVWSLADGKTLSDQPADLPRAGGRHPAFGWSADGAALLVGDALLDPATGKPVLPLPAAQRLGQPTPRLAVSATAVVYLDSSDRNNRRLKVHALTAEQASAAKAAVAAGGTAADALLPPLKPLDAAAASIVSVRLATAKWAAKLEPVPPVDYAVPIPLPVGVADLESVRVTGGADPAAVCETAKRSGIEADPATARTVRRVDVLTGRVTSQFELPPGVKVVHAGAGGHLVVTLDAADGRRVDVWDADTGKHIHGCRPFPDEKVALAVTPAAGLVAAVSATGKVVGWGVPDGKATFLADVPGLTAPALTPDGRYVYGVQSGRVRFLDATTGTPAGDLVPPFAADPAQPFGAAAVRPDGAEATLVLAKPGAGPRLVTWNLASGEARDAGPAPEPTVPAFPAFPGGYTPPTYAGRTTGMRGMTAAPTYVGGGFLLVHGKELYDPARQAVVWQFPLAVNCKPAAQRPDGRHWYAATVGASPTAVLVGADLPGAEAAATIAAVAGGKSVFKPGSGVRVKLTFEGSGAEAAEEKVRAWVKKTLADRKLTAVETDEDVGVAVKVAERDTGKKRQYRWFGAFRGFGQDYESVRVLELDCQAAVSVDGEVLWKSKPEVLKLPEYNPGITNVPAEEKDIEKYFHKTLWDQVPGWVERTALPRFLAKTEDGAKVLPQSTPLTAAGLTP
jgi:hypothetical protein